MARGAGGCVWREGGSRSRPCYAFAKVGTRVGGGGGNLGDSRPGSSARGRGLCAGRGGGGAGESGGGAGVRDLGMLLRVDMKGPGRELGHEGMCQSSGIGIRNGRLGVGWERAWGRGRQREGGTGVGNARLGGCAGQGFRV